MTQLSSNPIADILRQRVADRVARRSRVGEMVAATRANAVPSQVEQRTSPRLSLEELEALSESELGQRLQPKGPEDTRSGFVRFFDLLDLPRNLVANLAMRPFIDPDKIQSARKGALGLPQVTFSQALDQMGFEPGFIRGAIGFVGDVAMDPLTYLSGGAAAGAKIGLKAGSVGVRKGTAKVLNKTLANLAKGETFNAAKLSKRLGGLEETIARVARPEVIAAARRSGKTPTQIQRMLQDAILGRTRTPGGIGKNAGRTVITLEPEQIAGRIARGESFTAEQLAANPILGTVLDKAENLTDPADITKMVLGNIEQPVTLRIPNAPPLATPSFQAGTLARGIGTSEGIQSFLKREGRTAGLELRVPFTDSGIKLFERDARMKALQRLDDASQFAREIGDVGTGFPESTMHRVSQAIRGAAAPAETPEYRIQLANAIAGIDRGFQKFFGTGNRSSDLARQTRVSENSLRAMEATSHSMRIHLEKSLDDLIKNADPEAAQLIRDTAIAKLEIGLATAKDPNGSAVYAGLGGIDFSNVTQANASATAKQIREAKLRLAEAGEEFAWDEIFDTVADSMDEGLWFEPKVNDFVGEMKSTYSAIDESARKAGNYQVGLEHFFARSTTEEAARAIRQQGLHKVEQYGSSQEARILAEQGFEKHRTTNRYMWRDPESGELKNFYAFQLTDPSIKKQVDLAIEEGLVSPLGYQTSVYHANKLADEGTFAALLGGDWKGRMFDTNPASAVASNYRQVQRARIGSDFATYTHKFARGISDKNIQKFVSSSSPVIESVKGTPAYRVLTNGLRDESGQIIAEQGDLIRKVNIKANNPLFKNLGDEIHHYFDDRIATKIEDFASYFDDPGQIANFLSMTDGIVGQLRAVTLAHPSWLLTNIGSNTMSAAMMGASARHLPLFKSASGIYGKYQRFIKEGGQGINEFLDETIQIGERTFTNREILKVAESTGVLEQGRILRHIENTLGSSTRLLREKAEAEIPRLAQDVSLGRVTGPVKKAANIYTKGMAKWFLFNHNIEQRQRLWAMMTRLEKGDDLQQAATETIRHMFDYGDFTRFENDFARKLFYFYPWVRNNTPFMLTKAFEDPKWVAAFPKLKTALEDTIAEEDRIPEAMRPTWFKNQLGTQIGKRSGLLLPMLTQFQDVAEVGQALTGKREDIKEFLHYITSQLNPLYQLPFELASGREFFTGREIGDPDLGQQSVGEFLGSQLRPFREGTKLTDLLQSGRASEIPGRLIIGGRIQSFDAEKAARSNIFALSEDARKVRNEVNKSIRDGDRQRAIRLTIKLESLWRQILEIDPESDRVPNAVKDRLLAPRE